MSVSIETDIWPPADITATVAVGNGGERACRVQEGKADGRPGHFHGIRPGCQDAAPEYPIYAIPLPADDG